MVIGGRVKGLVSWWNAEEWKVVGLSGKVLVGRQEMEKGGCGGWGKGIVGLW